MAVHAGHGLDYGNVSAIAIVREISELSIGHSIVARAYWLVWRRRCGTCGRA